MKVDKLKNKCVILRKKGYSLKQLSCALGISKSTASLWVRNIELNNESRSRIEETKKEARRRGGITRAKNHQTKISVIIAETEKKMHAWKNLTQDQALLLCCFLYWAEGSKTGSFVSFTNSDPKMVAVFLYCFKKAFPVVESKFRALIHLHEYHDQNEELIFWSEITGIPNERFNKPYLKPHTGIRKRAGYHGTVRIRYYDSEIAARLKITYNVIANKIVGV